MNTLGIIMMFLSHLLLLILHCSCSFFAETRKRGGRWEKGKSYL